MTSNHYIYVHPFLQPSLLFTLTVSRVSHAKSILDLKAPFSLIHVQTPNPVPKVSIILLRSHSKTRMWTSNRYISNRTHIYQMRFFTNFQTSLTLVKLKLKLRCLITTPWRITEWQYGGEKSVSVPGRLSPGGKDFHESTEEESRVDPQSVWTVWEVPEIEGKLSAVQLVAQSLAWAFSYKSVVAKLTLLRI